MPTNGHNFEGIPDRSNSNRTFRSNYMKSSDIGRVPYLSTHLSQPNARGKFTESEFIRRANYWGKGVPDRQDLFCNGRQSRDRKLAKPSPVVSSSPRNLDRSVVDNKFRSRTKCLDHINDISDSREEGQKSFLSGLSEEEKRIIEEYGNATTSGSNDRPQASVAPCTSQRQLDNTPKHYWTDCSNSSVKSITARDLRQEGHSGVSDRSLDVSRRRTVCRSRSPSPRSARGRRRRRGCKSRSRSPRNCSYNAKKRTCFCVWCIKPRSSSCPRPRSRPKSPPWRLNSCQPKCGKVGQGSGGAKKEVVICLDAYTWSDSQIAVLKTFLKTSKCHEIIKLLSLVRTLIRDRYTTSCPKPCKDTLEINLCQVCKLPRDTSCDKSYGPSSGRTSSASWRGNNCKQHESTTNYSRKNNETNICSCKNNDTSGYSSKNYESNSYSCKNNEPRRPRRRRRSPSKTRKSCYTPGKNNSPERQHQDDNCESPCVKGTKLIINMPKVEDCTTEEDTRKMSSSKPRKQNVRSLSLDRKHGCKKINSPKFNVRVVKEKPKQRAVNQNVPSWTEVIKDCKQFLKSSQNQRCQGRHQLERTLIDTRYPYLDTQNNNDPETFTKTASVSDRHDMSEDDELEVASLCDEVQNGAGSRDVNSSHEKQNTSSMEDGRFKDKPRLGTGLQFIYDSSEPRSRLTSTEPSVSDKLYCKERDSLDKSSSKHKWEDVTQEQSGSSTKSENVKNTENNNETRAKKHQDCLATYNKSLKERNRVSNIDIQNQDSGIKNEDIESKTLLDINKNTQMLLDKASDRIKQVETYLDRTESTDMDNFRTQGDRTLDYDLNMTESEISFFRHDKGNFRGKKRRDISPKSYKPCNLTHSISEPAPCTVSSNVCCNPSSSEISDLVRKLTSSPDKYPNSCNVRRRHVNDDISCASMTSLDTTLSSCNVTAMKQSYQHFLKERTRMKKDKLSHKYNRSYEGDNELTANSLGLTSLASSSLDESYLRLPKKTSAIIACPVLIKCYEPSSPLPSRTQTHSD